MYEPRRHLLLAIVVALLVGHASLVAHAATHVGVDGADCEICVSYGDSAALAYDASDGVRRMAETNVGVESGATIPFRRSVELRQRGPPAIH